MLPRSVENAIAILSSRCSTPRTVDRELVVAFSTLSALAHYYPSQTSDEVHVLIQGFSWIREKEPSRWIRQRRIALAKLLNEQTPPAGSWK